MKNKTKKRTDADWLGTFTKKAVALILAGVYNGSARDVFRGSSRSRSSICS